MTVRVAVCWLIAVGLALAPATTVITAPLDANAGNWRMMVLSGPTQISVPLPSQVGGPEYVAELAAIKSAQASITTDERRMIDYWGHGGVLRWNEIMLALVSRYNLPPAPIADGTYPVPDANNPFADPNFPFANPPYAARAYAYVAVAQADALKAAWYYKFLYNRPSPARVDGAVRQLVRRRICRRIRRRTRRSRASRRSSSSCCSRRRSRRSR